MEMVYRGMPVELARQQYDKMKEEPVKPIDCNQTYDTLVYKDICMCKFTGYGKQVPTR